MSDRGGDPGTLLERATRAQTLSRAAEPEQPLLQAKACLAVAMARYHAQSPGAALAPYEECYASAVSVASGALLLRLETYRAVLFLTTGQGEDALAQFERILNRDHTGADPMALLRVRANYAAALNESGRFLAAIEELQTVFRQAVDLDQRNIALIVGNNLMVLLIEQQMYEAAGLWGERIEPLLAPDANPNVQKSIALHVLQLKILLGDAAEAAAELVEFLRVNADESDIITGSAYELLGDAYRATGQLSESYAATAKAVELLAGVPIELPDARLAMVRTLLAQERHTEALVVLDEIDKESVRPPRLREQVHGLRTRGLLSLNGRDDELEQFRLFVELGEQRSRDRAVQDMRYFEAARLAREQRSEIQRIEQTQQLLEAEAAASEARARESLALASGARKARNLWIAFFVVLLFALGLLIYQFERRRLTIAQKALTARLTGELEEKSAALVATVAEQAELEKAMAQKAHTQAIGRLTGNVAHDFNNLLQVISIANEQLGHAALDPAQQSVLDGSRSALAHAKTLIQQLLAYARRQNLKIEPVKFSSYISQTRALLEAAVGDTISLKIDDQSAGASAVVDASLLTTALLNLLSNAVDALGHTGQITIGADLMSVGETADPDWPELSSGDYLCVCVEDNGVGMSPDVLAQACEPFFSGKAPGSGSGLGLSSVQGFARQCGGDLRIVSEPRVLTRVVLALPATSVSMPSVSPGPRRAVGMENTRVLLVEDNDVLAATLIAMLQQMGANVDHAKSADKALAMLLVYRKFDVVLSDVRMSGELDGFKLYQTIRNRWPTLPVLLMTGHDGSVSDKAAPVILKPFSQNELVVAINRVRRAL